MAKTPTSNARSMNLIPGWGTKIAHASQCGQKTNYLKKIVKMVNFIFCVFHNKKNYTLIRNCNFRHLS